MPEACWNVALPLPCFTVEGIWGKKHFIGGPPIFPDDEPVPLFAPVSMMFLVHFNARFPWKEKLETLSIENPSGQAGSFNTCEEMCLCPGFERKILKMVQSSLLTCALP